MVEVHEITEEEWDQVLNVNLKAIFLCCKVALKVMTEQKRGSIVSISGTAGREGMALRGSLCAAKWGLLGLTQTIAKEAGPSGVRANIICPGGMDEADLREMYRDRAEGLGVSFEELWESVLKQTPLRKHALHEEVANAALFLRFQRLVAHHRGGAERFGWAVDVVNHAGVPGSSEVLLLVLSCARPAPRPVLTWESEESFDLSGTPLFLN